MKYAIQYSMATNSVQDRISIRHGNAEMPRIVKNRISIRQKICSDATNSVQQDMRRIRQGTWHVRKKSGDTVTLNIGLSFAGYPRNSILSFQMLQVKYRKMCFSNILLLFKGYKKNKKKKYFMLKETVLCICTNVQVHQL